MPTTYTLVVVNISTAPRHKTIKAMAFYKKMKMKVNGKWYRPNTDIPEKVEEKAETTKKLTTAKKETGKADTSTAKKAKAKK